MNIPNPPENEYYKILVTGTRSVLTKAQVRSVDLYVKEVLKDLGTSTDRVHFILGDCPTGIDAHFQEVCRKFNISHSIHVADWKASPRGGGVLRNQQMVDERPHLALGFPGHSSKGTWDCLRRCAREDVPQAVLMVGA